MFDGVSLPFTLSEVVSAAFELMKLVGPFILLGLAIYLTPKFIGLIKNAASNNQR